MQVAKFFLNKEYFPWSSFQRFDKSFVCRRFCWCVFNVKSFLWEYRLNIQTFLLDYSHKIKAHWSVLQELNVNYTIQWCNIRPLLPCPWPTCLQTISCFLWLTVFAPKVNSYPLGSLFKPTGIFRTVRKRVKTIFGQTLPLLTSRVSPAHPVVSYAHYFQAPAT